MSIETARIEWRRAPEETHETGPPQPPHTALDHAPVGADSQTPPALHPAVVDLKDPSGLAAARPHPPPAPQADGHDHPLGAEADIDDGRSGQAEHPLECGGNAHVVLLGEPLIFRTASSLPSRAAARSRVLRNLRPKPQQRKPP